MATRSVPGWPNAPVPVCYGGDPRALTFCCHPRYPLTFAEACRLKEMLKIVGLGVERYLEVKERFSKAAGWDSSEVCFGSLSYCCMRRRGCPYRDTALARIYDHGYEHMLEEYFLRKRVLAVKLLEACSNQSLVKPYLEAEKSAIMELGRGDLIKLLNTQL
ncbi:MAG: hypothetical protein J7L98_05270 [Candidatus Verstraetearchaeota archaeon]|nr:hypothetical protein [Candidatus Verstraetearchaeota archaeon]